MDRRTRVKMAMAHKETDCVPYQVNFTQQAAERFAGYMRSREVFDNLIHMELASLTGPGIAMDMDGEMFLDHFGVLWDRTGVDKDIGVVAKIRYEEPDVALLNDFPVPDEAFVRRQIDNMLRSGLDTLKIARISMAVFERAWSLRGMENFLTDMLAEEVFASALLDRIVHYNLRILDIVAGCDGVDGVYFGDDWGQQRPGLMMGPDTWRKFIKPCMKTLYGRVKASGKYVIQHSCGDNGEIFPDLIGIGLDMYNTFQPEIYDIERVKREFGGDLAIWGGVSTQALLPFATPAEVKKQTARLIRVMGKGGGYVVAPTHWIPGDVPPENIEAMVDVMLNQDSYR